MSAEGIERGEHRGKGGAHFAQSLDGLGLSAHTTAVGTYLLLGRFKMKTFFLYEISNHAQVLDIGGCIEPRTLIVATGLDYGEARFPKAQSGRWQPDYLGHLSDFVVFLIEIGGNIHSIRRVKVVDLQAKFLLPRRVVQFAKIRNFS